MDDTLVQTWKNIIVGDSKSWALFENGTCVVLMEPQDDLEKQAIELMKEYGLVHVGSPAGDFAVMDLLDHLGWVVSCHHPDILTYVAPDEIGDAEEVQIGLFGRSKRDADARELKVIYVEDRR